MATGTLKWFNPTRATASPVKFYTAVADDRHRIVRKNTRHRRQVDVAIDDAKEGDYRGLVGDALEIAHPV
jgi:hypothetical protein